MSLKHEGARHRPQDATTKLAELWHSPDVPSASSARPGSPQLRSIYYQAPFLLLPEATRWPQIVVKRVFYHLCECPSVCAGLGPCRGRWSGARARKLRRLKLATISHPGRPAASAGPACCCDQTRARPGHFISTSTAVARVLPLGLFTTRLGNC